MNTDERFGGIARLYGLDGLARLQAAHVAVVGIGGVGSWAAEALARSGVGEISLFDLDDVCITNTNRQVHAIDGVSVEHVRVTDGDHNDGGLLALALAAELAEAKGDERLDSLLDAVVKITDAEWVLVARGPETVASRGDAPSADWLHSLLAGSRHLGDPHATASDLFWSDLPASGLWLAAGRKDRPVHVRERVRLDLFVRIADTLLG